MPIFRLSKAIQFPPAHFANEDGLLCVGGDLCVKRLLLAYKNGIFPWFVKGEPILWWSPDPRLVLFPDNINISKSLKKKIKKKQYNVTIDNAFEKTILSCAKPRKKEENVGSWLGEQMIKAYIKLFEQGYAHSVETWYENELVGGLYGVCLGGIFFGESMFSFKSDASKIALVSLTNQLKKNNFDLIDCQLATNHLFSMGAKMITRQSFLDKIKKSTSRKDIKKSCWESVY